jgi:hypothetical protein
VPVQELSEKCVPKPEGPLKELNEAAWSYNIMNNDGTVYRDISDLDAIVISMKKLDVA